jgi:hypothetical protein
MPCFLLLARAHTSRPPLRLIFCGSCDVWKWKIFPDEQASSAVSIGTHLFLKPRPCSKFVLMASKGRCHTAVVVACNIIYFGGSLPSTNCISVLDTRTFKSQQITIRGDTVQKRLSHCAAVVDGSMIIVGGWSVNSQRASSTLRDCFQIRAIVSAASCVPVSAWVTCVSVVKRRVSRYKWNFRKR